MPELSDTRVTSPSYGQCRAAARGVRAAELGEDAVDTVRPRGPLGVIRSRGPLSILLYVAAHDGLLIWRNTDSFALLQPPGDRPRPGGGGFRWGVLRRVTRHWDMILFAAPPAVMLLGAVLVTLPFGTTGSSVSVSLALLLVMGAVLHIATLVVCLCIAGLIGAVRALVGRRPGDDAIAAELLPGRHWTMTLCHHVDGRPADVLLRLVDRRLHALITADARLGHAELGAEAPVLNVTETLVCAKAGVTTRRTRDAVEDADRAGVFGAGGHVSLRLAPHRAGRRPLRLFDRGGFVLWYLGGATALVVVVAGFVADWERADCRTGDCAGRPVTYGLAVRWLTQRLLFTDPYGLSPATHRAWTIGWLFSLMSLMGVFVIVAATQQYVRYRTTVVDALSRKMDIVLQQPLTLVMVATEVEQEAVLAAVRAVNGTSPQRIRLNQHVVLDLGTVGGTDIRLARVRPGTVDPGSAAISAASLITGLNPQHLVLTGICYGLRPESQQLGDVLVCSQLRAIDHRKEAEPADGDDGGPDVDAPRRVLYRGDFVSPSTRLLNAFTDAARDFDAGRATVHVGPMLSANVLVSARSLHDELRRQQPDAVGGEMEGAGVYAAAAPAKVDWIVVKAICDFGFDKTDRYQKRAADNAARLVVHAAEIGVFDEAPKPGVL